MYGSLGTSAPEGGERREGGKRGRRPGRKAQLDKQDMKAKLGINAVLCILNRFSCGAGLRTQSLSIPICLMVVVRSG